MKQMSQIHDYTTEPTPARHRAPAAPVGTVSEADLDKVSGGGGLRGGVVGSRGPARD